MRQFHDAMRARSVHTVLHIGAGKGSELDGYLAASPALIVLVEPNPDAVKVLRHKAGVRSEIEIVAAAVTAERGEADLAVFNLSEMSSLREPTGLYQLYPGLKVVQHRRVETVPVTDLLDHAPTESDGENWLIVDAPGEERAVVDALIENAALRRFQQVVLRCGREPLYDGAAAGAEVVALLEDHGFMLDGSPDEQDPDRPIWSLRLDRNRLESEQLSAELSSLQQRLEASEGENATLKEQYAALTAERDQLTKDLAAKKHSAQEAQTQLEKTKQQLEQESAHAQELAKERDELSSLQQRLEASEGENATLKKQNAALTAERDQLAKDVAAKEQSAQEAETQLDETKQQFEQESAHAQELAGERDELKSALANAEAQAGERDSLAQERDRLENTLNDKQQELERLQSDLGVALRMQSIRESDLRDLQERYGELLESKTQQDELLDKLTNRLSAASEHLKLMELKADGGDTPDAPVGELVRALSGNENQ